MSQKLMHHAVVAMAVLTSAAQAQDWPQWRGPAYDGSSDVKDLPDSFSKEKNVRWVTRLPGPGASTPIVHGERIFLTAVDTARERLVAMALDRKDGKVLWQRDADSGEGADLGSRIRKDPRSTYVTPSPVTDGERVVFFFGNGDLVALDLEGKEIWRRNIQKDYGRFAFQWTFSASPTLWEGRLFLPVLQRDTPVDGGGGRRRRGNRDAAAEPPSTPAEPIESFLLAIDPATGKTIYKHVRPSPAQVESLECYATMIPHVGKDDRKEILCVGGDVLTGHDPATGKELWRWGTWNPGHRERMWRVVPSVVVGGGVAAICAPKRAPVHAVRIGGDGDLGEKALAWRSEGRRNPVSSDVPTPAFHDGHFFVLSDMENALSKVEAATGKVVWTTELSNEYLWRASPTVADGRIWCMNHNGQVVAIDAVSGKLSFTAQMGDEKDDDTCSTIVAAHGVLFIRTNSSLFCVGR